MRRCWALLVLASACADPVAPQKMCGTPDTQMHQYIEARLGTEFQTARFVWCDPPWHMVGDSMLVRDLAP